MEDLKHLGLGVVFLPELGRACDESLVFEDRALLAGEVPAAKLSLKGSFTAERSVSEVVERIDNM